VARPDGASGSDPAVRGHPVRDITASQRESGAGVPGSKGLLIEMEEVRTMMRIVGLCALLILVATGQAKALVPATLSYQGLLEDASGVLVPDGTYSLTFRLYNQAGGGTALWSETQSLPVSGGVFSAVLGSVTSITLPFDVQYWISLQVASNPELPRVVLTSAPYALRASVAESLVGGSGDVTAVYADNGLTGGATSGEAHLSVGVGTGLTVEADQVHLSETYATGAAYDGRFVNEAQANSITADMVIPNIASSVDGVVNDGGNIDLIAGTNVTITPDDANNTITIASTGGGGIGGSGTAGYVPKFTAGTTLGNSLAYDTGSAIGIGTTIPTSRLSVTSSADNVADFTGPLSTVVQISSPSFNGDERLYFSRAGVIYSSLSEDRFGLTLNRGADEGGISLLSARADEVTSAAVTARYTGGLVDDYIGLYAKSVPADFYGIGGSFEGGYMGARGVVHPSGSSYYLGVYGDVTGGSGTSAGVCGHTEGTGVNYGVHGWAGGGISNYAGYFLGDVQVVGNLTVSGTKSFRIDHPLDPANKYLNHFCVESDEVLNTYRGNVVLDQAGEAWVELAEWFGSISADPTYQLTCIGGHAPVYVAEEISGNRFKIAGGTAGMKVSWQVTAVRNDAVIEKHRLPVEQEKPAGERGKYLEPEVYGASETQRIGHIELKEKQ
jgi:hypothetical protein